MDDEKMLSIFFSAKSYLLLAKMDISEIEKKNPFYFLTLILVGYSSIIKTVKNLTTL